MTHKFPTNLQIVKREFNPQTHILAAKTKHPNLFVAPYIKEGTFSGEWNVIHSAGYAIGQLFSSMSMPRSTPPS
jgi:hypothetical protein